MQVQPVNKQNNITMQALYFPKKPENIYVKKEIVRDAIKNNPFISKLSEQADVFVRYWNAKNVYYSMHIDVVDLQKKKTKVSMTYTSKTFMKMPDISETDFISQIKEPHSDKKGNLLKKIMRCSRMHHEEQEYYHMGFVGPHLVRKKFCTYGPITPGMAKIMDYAIRVQKNLWNMNKETMEEIAKK